MAHMSPRVKRAYQPTLDTYLLRSTALSSHPVPTLSAEDVAVDHTSAIDNTVQSSLLSVGMRVRKALSSGYQNAPKLYQPAPSVTSPLGDVSGNTRFKSSKSAGPMPMCGINKVGGFDIQPFPTAYDQENDNEAWPSSQESTMTSASMDIEPKAPGVSQTTGKRRYQEDAEDADCEDNSLFTSTAHANAHVRYMRPKARAFARRRQSTRMQRSADVVMADPTDFEDAPFLLPPTD